jgi:hypothetical protein
MDVRVAENFPASRAVDKTTRHSGGRFCRC